MLCYNKRKKREGYVMIELIFYICILSAVFILGQFSCCNDKTHNIKTLKYVNGKFIVEIKKK